MEALGQPSTDPEGSEEPSGRNPTHLGPPWKRLTTPGHRSSSEELNLEPPTSSGAPRSTEASQRETAPRLHERPLTVVEAVPHPEGWSTDSVKAIGPSRNPSANRWTASSVRRPPRHSASLCPSPGTMSQTPSTPPRPEGRVGEGGEYVEAPEPVDRLPDTASEPRRAPRRAKKPASRSWSSSTPTSRRAVSLRRATGEARAQLRAPRTPLHEASRHPLAPKSHRTERGSASSRPGRPLDRLGLTARPRRVV